MKFSKKVWPLLALGFTLGLCSWAVAEEGGAKNYYQGPAQTKEGRIHIGHVSIIPGISVQGEYDDNIFLGNGDNETTERKESDWLTHIKPALTAKYDMLERGALSLGYTGDFAYYNTNTGMNWASHKLAFKGDYLAPVGLIVGLSNDYVNSEDPYSDANLYRLGEKTKRWYDDLQTKIGYQLADRYRILGYYNFYKQQYDLDRDYSQDYDSNEVGLGAEMRVMPMTWAFLRYHTGERNYTNHNAGFSDFNDGNDADFKWNRVNTGLAWDATAKITGELNLGYQWLTANNEVDPYGNPYEDHSSWIASTRVNYLATAKTRVGAELFRATRFSGGDLSEFYDETGLGLNLNQHVLNKGVIRAGAGYAIYQYNQPTNDKREDDNYKALVGFDYHFREWLMAGVEYRYWNRDSNVRLYDFTDNRFMMTVGVEY